MALQGRFSFPGLDPSVVIGAQYSRSRGITAEVITVDVPAGTAVPKREGTAVFEYGGNYIRVANCCVDLGQSRIGDSPVWTFAIKDGRWRWEYGQISGHYNTPNPDGSIRPGTEKTAPQLATLCLQAMKESRYDLSGLNSAARPRVDWSYQNPAQALASLADALGCVVVLKMDGTVCIVQQGQGANLPNLPSMSVDFSYQAGVSPAGVLVVGGAARLQGRWKLRPVADETDGSVKPADEVSYKPAEGWETQRPGLLTGVQSTEGDSRTDPRKLALGSVFVKYQIDEFIGPKNVAALGLSFDGRSDCLPILNGLAETYTASQGDGIKLKPAIVRGTFASPDLPGQNVENETYKGKFNIVPELGVVEFEVPVYKRADGTFEFADLTLEVGFPVKLEGGEPYRGLWRYPVSPRPDVGDYVLRKEEIILTARLDYSETGDAKSWKDNRKEDQLDQQARYAAQVYVAGLSPVEAGSRQYPGIVPIEPDGAITQVSWQVGGGGFSTTRASRNSEHDTDIYPPYRARRKSEKSVETAAKVDQIAVRAEQNQYAGKM